MSFYLIVLLVCISVPFAFSFEKNLRLYKRWKYVFSGIFITMLIFISWDVIFTHMGIWEFNPRYNSGIYIFGLPLEEHLFFIAIPYACLFSYYAIQFHFPWYKVNEPGTKIMAGIIVIASLILAFTNTHHIYTMVVFLVVTAYTVFSYIFARKVLQRYLAIFPVLFIPFLIVNGVLTGTGIEQEVFSYDESRIIGLRIFTMPMEDGVYCFSLLLSVMVFTELLEGRSKKKEQK